MSETGELQLSRLNAAVTEFPRHARQPAIDQNGDVLDDTFAADITGLLDLQEWTGKIPGLRIILRDEPLHPRYRKRATEREKKLGRRYQLIATNTPQGQIAWLDARQRSAATAVKPAACRPCRLHRAQCTGRAPDQPARRG